MHDILRYDPLTGLLHWKINKRNVKQGTIAGNFCNTHKYIKIMVNKKNYYAHRICWFLYYNKFPSKHLDHINGVRHDNRICNLREATEAQNSQNLSIRKTNKTGYVGVSWCKKTNKFYSRIHVNNKKIFLGYFETAELAYEAYAKAKITHHSFNPIQRTKPTNYPLALYI
jgi:hypothetical protein